jgi:hypothetical protein
LARVPAQFGCITTAGDDGQWHATIRNDGCNSSAPTPGTGWP